VPELLLTVQVMAPLQVLGSESVQEQAKIVVEMISHFARTSMQGKLIRQSLQLELFFS
jgi:hypothetical protein